MFGIDYAAVSTSQNAAINALYAVSGRESILTTKNGEGMHGKTRMQNDLGDTDQLCSFIWRMN